MADENREKTLSHLSLFQIFRRISRSVREFKRPALLTPLLVTGEVIIECTIPFITAQLINALNEGQGMDAIAHYSLILVALALVSLACGTVAGITCANASTGLARNLRHDMFHNIQSFSFGNIDRFSTSSLVTRLTTDVGFVQMAFMQIIRTAIRSPLMLVFAIFMAYITGGALATVYVIVAILLGTFLFGIALYVMPIFRRLFRKYDALNDTVEENIKGIRVVKAFVREKYEKQKFDTSSGNLRDDFLHAERLLAWNMPVMQLAINVVYVFVIFFGSRAIVESQGTNLALGQLSALITYGFSILMSLNMLSMIFVMLTMSEESARRIVEVLEEQSDLANPENPVYEVPDGSIDFDHVSFEYAGNIGEKALTDIRHRPAHQERRGHRHHRRHRLVQNDAHPAHQPPLRRHRGNRERRRHRRARLRPRHPARPGCRGAPAQRALLGHDQGQPALGQEGRHRRRDARGVQARAGR